MFLLSAFSGILRSENATREVNENWNELIGDALDLDFATNPQNISETIRDFYIGSNENITKENRDNLTNLFSDRFYIHPAKVFADYHVKNKGRRDSVYLYVLSENVPKSYASSLVKLWDPLETDFGASHADEVQFLFPNGKFPRIDLGSPFANFSQMMVKIWVNFANTG